LPVLVTIAAVLVEYVLMRMPWPVDVWDDVTPLLLEGMQGFGEVMKDSVEEAMDFFP